MTLDLDTFLTIVSCMVDSVYQTHIAPARPQRPGPRPELHDREVLTLMLVAQWHPSRSERKVGRYAAKHWRASFPHLLSQSQFNRRARDLHGAFARLAPLLAEQVIAATPLPEGRPETRLTAAPQGARLAAGSFLSADCAANSRTTHATRTSSLRNLGSAT